jgi:hypothetical protein
MKTRRKFLMLLSLLVVFPAFAAGWFVFSANQRVTKAQIERLKLGMTEEEIAAILNAPPDHVVDGRTIIGLGTPSMAVPNWSEMDAVRVWQGSESVTIGFDVDGKSRRIESWYVFDSTSTWDRICRLVLCQRLILGLPKWNWA